MAQAKKSKTLSNTIALNKKSRFDYFLLERFEVGLMLQGWEVKSLRAKKVQLSDAYILIKNNEAWLFGALITPLATASTHIIPDPQRTRKLLLHRAQLDTLIGAVERKGQALIPTAMYWSKSNKAKLEIALATGKKQHDKRATEKDRDWGREKQRVMKSHKE
jgi:SsrA-binding protein